MCFLSSSWLNEMTRHVDKGREKAREDIFHDRIRDLLQVGIEDQISRLDHVHPDLAIVDQFVFEGLPCGVLQSDDACESLLFEVVFEHIPGKFMGELKTLNETLMFSCGQRSVLSQFHRLSQGLQGLAVILKALHPADVGRAHGRRVPKCGILRNGKNLTRTNHQNAPHRANLWPGFAARALQHGSEVLLFWNFETSQWQSSDVRTQTSELWEGCSDFPHRMNAPARYIRFPLSALQDLAVSAPQNPLQPVLKKNWSGRLDDPATQALHSGSAASLFWISANAEWQSNGVRTQSADLRKRFSDFPPSHKCYGVTRSVSAFRFARPGRIRSAESVAAGFEKIGRADWMILLRKLCIPARQPRFFGFPQMRNGNRTVFEPSRLACEKSGWLSGLRFPLFGFKEDWSGRLDSNQRPLEPHLYV
jgi:hypothetical protein